MMDNEDFIELPVDSWTIVRSSKLTELEREADQAKASLIAQYDAIVAAVKNACPAIVRLDTSVSMDMHQMYDNILYAISQHDPRKGAE